MFEIKKPTVESKGILIFSHQERRFLASSIGQKTLKSLDARYLSGVYFGGHVAGQKDITGISFFLSSPGTLEQDPTGQTFRIPLNAFNFIPNIFSADSTVPKFWDVMISAYNNPNKNIKQFIQITSKMLDLRPGLRILLVTFFNPKTIQKEDRLNGDIAEWLREFYSIEKLKQLTLMELRRRKNLYPLPSESMVHLFRQSRIFVLLSDKEGASRSISESLMCGTPVATKKKLKGGTNYFLRKDHSVLIDKLDTAPQDILTYLDSFDSSQFDYEYIRDTYSEEVSAQHLLEHFQKLYGKLGLNFSGEPAIADLGQKIPSHFVGSHSARMIPGTNIPKSFSDWMSHFAEVFGINFTITQRSKGLFMDVVWSLRKFVGILFRRIKT